MNLINKMSKRTIERLRKRIQSLESKNSALVKENSTLKERIVSYESTMADLQKIESDYKLGISEMVKLKKEYRQAIFEIKQLKAKYSKESEKLLKQMRKDI